ncbi:MAG: bifunctional diguanylate cyclase/phosphodiesterase [Clostridia bacterium]|nr:bifunctional diguanylate cyclase/phosphodiesterase [Clostridia bacterium]
MFKPDDILNSLSEAIIISEPDYDKILYANHTAELLLGDIVGKTQDEAFKGKLLVHPSNSEYDNKDGIKAKIYKGTNGKAYALYSKQSEIDGKSVIIETLADITAAEEERNDLSTRLTREHIIVSCIIEMHRNKPFDETINHILEITGKYLDAERVYLFKYTPEKIFKTHTWCRDDVEEKIAIGESINQDITENWYQKFDTYKSILIDNIEDLKNISSAAYDLLKQIDVNCIVISPLYAEDKFIGFIGVDNLPSDRMAEGETFFTALSTFISMVIVRDRNEKTLRRLSYIDTLTNIYNRNKFIDDREAMAEAGEKNIGVVYMDLNGLKEINDKKGHAEGDNALREMARRIGSVFGGHTAYRVGGDEFVVFCRGIKEKDFDALTDKFIESLHDCDYKIAIGTQYAGEDSSLDDIIRIADENMYRDKMAFYRHSSHSGRYRVRNDNFIAISTPEKIKKLISEERFVIWFQPRFSAITGEFSGSEALIRFFDEDDMIVSPMDFIPEMEDNDTIHLLDLYVFRHVCEYLSGWIKNGKKIKPVSMNMSHATLRKPNIIENLLEIWYNYNVPKELIIIEVSEDQENGGISDITDVLGSLKKCGFHLAIDNFGAKYADLYLFADLKFDVLKLDGDMVYKIETDKKTQILSTSIMQICHNENIRIVAAGIENEQELTALREIGCDEAQGYYFDKPMSWNKFEEKYL